MLLVKIYQPKVAQCAYPRPYCAYGALKHDHGNPEEECNPKKT